MKFCDNSACPNCVEVTSDFALRGQMEVEVNNKLLLVHQNDYVFSNGEKIHLCDWCKEAVELTSVGHKL